MPVFKPFRIIKDWYLIIIIEYSFSNKTQNLDCEDKWTEITVQSVMVFSTGLFKKT